MTATTATVSFQAVKNVFDEFILTVRRSDFPVSNVSYRTIMKDCDPANPLFCKPQLAHQHYLVNMAFCAAMAR